MPEEGPRVDSETKSWSVRTVEVSLDRALNKERKDGRREMGGRGRGREGRRGGG